MDKKRLKKHKANKDRLKRLEDKIQELCGKEVRVVSGKVTGSSQNFPYTEVRTSVEMYDPRENDEINRQIREKEKERIELQQEVDEVEEYIADIKDSEIREIFELSFAQGKKQKEVAAIVNIDRSYVSKKISDYLQLSHNSQI